MGALHDQANSLRDMNVKEASAKQEQEAKDKWAIYINGYCPWRKYKCNNYESSYILCWRRC